ncbi:MAG: magnesium transporter [Sphingomonadaceae bacterium]
MVIDILETEAAIRRLVADGRVAEAAALLADAQPADGAEALWDVPADTLAAVLAAMPPAGAARLVGYFDPARQLELARTLPRAAMQKLFAAMPHDERADLWKALPEDARDALLPGLAAAEREDIRRLASYAEGTAGSIMTSDYVTLLPTLGAAAALDVLRREAPDRETIYDCYVIDDDRRLLGVVSLRDILLAPAGARIADIMTRDVVFARADDPREAVAEQIADYDLLAIPVVDPDDRLVGIVTVDDALDVAEAALARRLTRFGGSSAPEGVELDLMGSGLATLYRGRVVWLALLAVVGIVTSTLVAAQSALLEQVIVLAAFITPIIAMGGNTGSQSATLVIRAMALGQVDSIWRDVLRVLARDLPVAIALGLTVAGIVVGLSWLTKGGLMPEVLMAVGLSMVAVTVAGSLFGVLIPFLARAAKVDPATLSAPLITSMMDLVGVLIYFGIASALLAEKLAAA